MKFQFKKSAFIILATLVWITMAHVNAFADSIGYVDMQRIFVNYGETKKAEENFKKKQDDLKTEFEKRQKKVETAKAKGKDDEAIQKLISELEEELKPKQQELMALHTQLMNQLKQEILVAAKKVAKEYGIDVVIDKQAIYYGGFDLTDFVIERLNK
jgi:outer membrane protein